MDEEVREVMRAIADLDRFVERLEKPPPHPVGELVIPECIRDEAFAELVMMARRHLIHLRGWLRTVDRRSFDG